MGGKNTEGYSNPTAMEAVSTVIREEKQKLKDMCNCCKHQGYCGAAYKKDTWCGNYTRNGGR